MRVHELVRLDSGFTTSSCVQVQVQCSLMDITQIVSDTPTEVRANLRRRSGVCCVKQCRLPNENYKLVRHACQVEFHLTFHNHVTDSLMLAVTGRDCEPSSVDPLISALRRSVSLCAYYTRAHFLSRNPSIDLTVFLSPSLFPSLTLYPSLSLVSFRRRIDRLSFFVD